MSLLALKTAHQSGKPRRWRFGLGRLVVLSAVTLNLFAIAAVLLFLAQARSQAQASAATTTQNLAELLDKNLTASCDKIVLTLQAVVDEVESHSIGRLDDRGLDALLARYLERVPDLLALRLVDRDGNPGRSVPPATDSRSLADRDYFNQLRRGARSVVSRPLVGRVRGTPVLVFGRPLFDRDGAFAGAVLGSVDLAHVAAMVADPDVGPHGIITVRSDDLSVVARSGYGSAVANLRETAASESLRALVAEGRTEASYDSASALDRTVRTYSFRRLAHYPFYVIVGLAHEDYLASWYRQAALAAFVLAGLLALTSLGAWLTRRVLRQQRRAEDDLVRAQRAESLAVLAGGIAHDFNNLLTGITGNISMAREDVAPGSPTDEALGDAQTASLRARGLTQQLLTFSRGGSPVKRPLELSPVVAEAARFTVHGSGTALRLELESGLIVEADAGQVGQVVQNLVLNGVQAMGSRGTLLVRTELAARTTGVTPGASPSRQALISVVDSGPGIQPEALAHIFDPFFTTKAQGKGLGLAICHSIVGKHDGHLEVTSPAEGGATFRVWLPVVESAPADVAPPSPPEASHRAVGQRLLVMDDEEAVRRLVKRLLQPLGYEVVEARDGEEVVARHAEAQETGRPFDAVIMDLTIPGGMGGLEAMGRIRRRDPAVVAIVSSGYSSDPVMATWAEHGFAAALAKPYVAGELRDTLRDSLLARGRSTRSN